LPSVHRGLGGAVREEARDGKQGWCDGSRRSCYVDLESLLEGGDASVAQIDTSKSLHELMVGESEY
jgi:hypothetical protein